MYYLFATCTFKLSNTIMEILNTEAVAFSTHAHRGLRYMVCKCVCLSVCLLTCLLQLYATRQQNSDTNWLLAVITSLILGARMHSEGYGTWSVRLCVCVFVYLYSQTTGNEAAHERYTHLQHNKRLKNNVADLAKTAAFWQEKLALPWTTFCDQTHQLVWCACLFRHMIDWLSTWSSSAWSPALL